MALREITILIYVNEFDKQFINKFRSLSRSFNFVPTLTTNLCFSLVIRVIFALVWFGFIYATVFYCFLVFMFFGISHSLTHSFSNFDFVEAENITDHSENLQFFF